jgi:hypothetical protein
MGDLRRTFYDTARTTLERSALKSDDGGGGERNQTANIYEHVPAAREGGVLGAATAAFFGVGGKRGGGNKIGGSSSARLTAPK